MKVIERDELGFRQRVADEFFARGHHVLFRDEDQPFDRDEFVAEMHLGMIAIEPDLPDAEYGLWYEYADGVEHGIIVVLSWDGDYLYAQ